jgi:hypothetical protein
MLVGAGSSRSREVLAFGVIDAAFGTRLYATMTIGIVLVARLAALRLASGPPARITSTFCRTRSAAIAEVPLEPFGI